MRDHQGRRASNDSGGSIAVGFVLGALVGAGIALLLAPAEGRDTRRRLAESGDRLRDAARGARDRARDVATDLAHDARSALEQAREKPGSPSRPTSPTESEA